MKSRPPWTRRTSAILPITWWSYSAKGTQFVVVTHRKGTMERCDSLYGVAMEEQGVSKMVSVSLQDYAS